MKLLGKTKDQAVGNLLRAYISRPANPRQVCTDFDPDFASAYVEGRLTVPSRARYEAHLSECVACRKGAVALARMAQAELSASAARAGLKERANWLAAPGELLRRLSAPQWAMAAAAVVVLAISLPLLLSRNQADLFQPESKVAPSLAVESARPSTPASGEPTTAKPGDASPARLASSDSKQAENRKAERSSAMGSLAANAPAPHDDRATSEELQKTEAKPQTQIVDQVQAKAESQVASQAPAPPGQALGDAQQLKKDADRGQQPEKEVAQATEPKAVALEAGSDKEKARRAEQAAAPPETPRVAESNRPLGRSRGKLGLRDSSANEAVPPRTADREIRGKKFFLKDGTWTDKDYNPDKDLPTITLIRDSNVYKEVLAKRTSLKPYLDQFYPSERAIIVYKGTVYKLIPQNGK
ncbi:MAG TPA: zf-HC2 domain-containing protein [Blastocatellia bacterium]|nr:zf-HC2 domain-containing protein [Blastocatellia bacterium]